MTDTGRVDITDPTANMYGCSPCPKCASVFRVPFQNDNIECDECGFVEPITVDVEAERRGA